MKNGKYNCGEYELWYKDGVLHREDGPAIIYYDGAEAWYHNGKLHREDGPAVIKSSGEIEWHMSGVRYENVFEYATEAGWSESKLASYILLNGDNFPATFT